MDALKSRVADMEAMRTREGMLATSTSRRDKIELSRLTKECSSLKAQAVVDAAAIEQANTLLMEADARVTELEERTTTLQHRVTTMETTYEEQQKKDREIMAQQRRELEQLQHHQRELEEEHRLLEEEDAERMQGLQAVNAKLAAFAADPQFQQDLQRSNVKIALDAWGGKNSFQGPSEAFPLRTHVNNSQTYLFTFIVILTVTSSYKITYTHHTMYTHTHQHKHMLTCTSFLILPYLFFQVKISNIIRKLNYP